MRQLRETGIEHYAAKALEWVEANMASYSDEAKARVMAALIQSYTVTDENYPVTVQLQGDIGLEGNNEDAIRISATVF